MEINEIKMIIDRSQSDIDIAKSLIKKGFQNMTSDEKQSFLSGLKGAYNYSDFNRIEATVYYLANRLKDIWIESETLANELGVAWDEMFNYPYDKYRFDDISTKYDWSVDDILNKANRERYINNIKTILISFIDDITDIPNSLEKMNFEGANNIEKQLLLLNEKIVAAKNNNDNMMLNASKSWAYSGDVYGGEI